MLPDDDARCAEKIADARLSVSLNVWEGMAHGFQLAIGTLVAADAVIGEIAAFLQGCLLQTMLRPSETRPKPHPPGGFAEDHSSPSAGRAGRRGERKRE